MNWLKRLFCQDNLREQREKYIYDRKGKKQSV